MSFIQTDPARLEEILSNLIGNALKFTNQGEIAFGYVLKDQFIEFYVSDTGIGIPSDQHEKIFDRFYQVENAVSRKYEGTGLGLSICKSYVELLGGKIWLTSEPGRGSVFFFTIPYKPSMPFSGTGG
jgi:signal transduction histidine kinase